MKKILLPLISMIILFPQISSAAWRYFDTDHFTIIYQDNLSTQALKVSEIAERHYHEMTTSQKWKPYSRVNLIINGNLDISNGYATPIPNNTIMMYIPQPEPDSVIGNLDIWLENLFVHEYTHILNMDARRGWWIGLNILFGRTLCFPNVFLPMWQLEGNAVYNESLNGGGRLHSSYADMVMRTDLLRGTDKTLSDAAHASPDEWPTGNTPYLYGAYFVRYLSEKYPTPFAEQFNINSRRFIPMRVNSNFKKAYGVNISDEWQLFKDNQRKISEERERSIKENGETAYTVLYHSSRMSSYPHYSGSSVYFFEDTAAKGKFLSRIDANGEVERIKRVSYPTSLSVNNDTIFYTDMQIYYNTHLLGEIYRVKNGWRSKLTDMERAIWADAQGAKLAYIKLENGNYSLVLSDTVLKKRIALIENTSVHLSSCAISPDEKRIAFTYRTYNGKGSCGIAVIEIETGKILSLSENQSINMQPAWNGNSKVLYSSDRTGVFNIYECDIDKNKTVRLTNFVTGGFSPDISDDGKTIVCAVYEKEGFAIASLPYREIDSTPSPIKTVDPSIFIPGEDLTPENSLLYLSLLNIDPWAWGGSFSVSGSTKISDNTFKNKYLLLGVNLTDPLLKQNLTFYSISDFSQKRNSIVINHIYNHDLFQVVLNYTNERLFWSKDEFPYDNEVTDDLKRKTEHKGSAGIIIPYSKITWNTSIATQFTKGIRYTDTYYNGIEDHRKEHTGKFESSFNISNMKIFPSSVTTENGIALNAYAENYRKKLSDDIDLNTYFSTLRFNIPSVFNNHQLSAQFKGGYSDSNNYGDDPFDIGASATPVSYSMYSTSPGIRGYEDGSLYGNRYLGATAEYIFPIIRKDAGISTLPLYHSNTYMRLFFDAAQLWSERLDKEIYRSAGAELFVDFNIFYLADLTLMGGYAHPFDNNEKDEFYLRLLVPTVF